jgi:death on curing protein
MSTTSSTSRASSKGEPPRVRDYGLLSSAAARPASVAFGQEAYPDL